MSPRSQFECIPHLPRHQPRRQRITLGGKGSCHPVRGFYEGFGEVGDGTSQGLTTSTSRRWNRRRSGWQRRVLPAVSCSVVITWPVGWGGRGGPVAEGVDDGDARRLEMPDVAGNHGEPVLQGRGGNEQVDILVADGGREPAPSARRSGTHRQDAVCKPCQDTFRPLGKVTGKVRVSGNLLGNPRSNSPNVTTLR